MSEPTDTLHLSNLDDRVTQRHLYEICCNAGPIKRVTINDSSRNIFAFVQYESRVSPDHMQCCTTLMLAKDYKLTGSLYCS